MTEHKCFVFRFADVEVREREFSIVKAGEVVAVEPKAFRVLLYLLRNPHRLIPKDELLDAVWNDVAVSENSLTRSIALLRRLLGDDTREPRYIATVPTVGYRFLCDVVIEEEEIAQPAPADSAQNEPEPIPLTGTPATAPLRNRLLYALIAAVLVLGAAGLIRHFSARNPDPPNTRTQPAAASTASRDLPLTNLPGSVNYPSFSPDAEKIAFIWYGENPGKGDVYIQLVGGEKPLRLTHTSSGFTCCADWSPDGHKIAFGRCYDNGGGVFTVPALGGPERKLTDVDCSLGDAGYPKWIDGGKELLLVDRCVPDGPRGIVVFSLETGQKRCLTTPPSPGDLGDNYPALSPDGKTVAFLRGSTVGKPGLHTVGLSGQNLRQITHEGIAGSSPMWSSDGQRIIFNSTRSGLLRVWQVAAAGGVIAPETVYPGTGSLSRDGRRLAYVDPPLYLAQSLVIRRIELSRAGGQVISQNNVHAADGGNNAPQPSPDGRQIVFESCRTGRCEIWRSDADGSNLLPLTLFDWGWPGTPRWSPDGKWIAFDFHHGKHIEIYLVDSEGRNLHSVASGTRQDVVPSWSRDGKSIYFASDRTRSWQVWKRELATGLETQLTHHGGFAAFESYDAKTLYYSKFEDGGIWSIPVGGGEERQVLAALHRGYWGHFALTDSGIYFLDADALPKPTVMYYNFRAQQLKPVLQLEADPVPWAANLAASRDGRTIWLAQGIQHSSIVMAENFQ